MLPAILLALVFLSHATWWGGWTYGPRYLTAVPVLLLYRLLPPIAEDKRLARITLLLSAFGCVCAFAAKSTAGYSLPTEVRDPLTSIILPAVLNGQWTAQPLPAVIGLSTAMATFSFPVFLLVGMFVLILIDRRRSART